MYHVLTDVNIPFQYKREMTYKILMQHLDLSTAAGRIRFIICIVSMIHIFTISDVSGLVILIQNLIDAIKSGKISKRIARLIIRRLKRLKIPIDPELIEFLIHQSNDRKQIDLEFYQRQSLLLFECFLLEHSV